MLLLFGHTLVDMYSNLVPASLGVIRKSWELTDAQAALLLGLGSLASGLAQPVFAWISDHTDSRLYGGLGLSMGAVFISCIGFAVGPTALFVFYLVGMAGVGMFHPIGASTIGQISQQRRSKAVSLFFVAGMMGGISGAFIGPRLLTIPNGFYWLTLLMFPGLVVAYSLHRNIAPLQHRSIAPAKSKSPKSESAWLAIALLYGASALRFAVNVALFYLYVRWMESVVSGVHPGMPRDQVADIAAPWAGNMNAATIAGMALGGLTAGMIIPSGREKWPLVVVPILFAPCIAFIPHSPLWFANVFAFGAGIAFASMVPVSLALAQRLIPHRSSLVSGLMLGGAWAVAMLGPTLAEWNIGRQGIPPTFYWTAVVLAASGVILCPISGRMIRNSS